MPWDIIVHITGLPRYCYAVGRSVINFTEDLFRIHPIMNCRTVDLFQLMSKAAPAMYTSLAIIRLITV